MKTFVGKVSARLISVSANALAHIPVPRSQRALLCICAQVISDKANKTILVAVDRWMVVPKYKKRIKRTSKLMAHDEENDCRMGDIVRIDISRCVVTPDFSSPPL